MKHIYTVVLMFVLALALSLTAEGATRTASVTGNWSNTGTWGGAAVPTSADAVVINAGITVTVDIAAAAASVVVNSTTSNNGITLSGTNTLDVTGAITMNAPSSNSTSAINVGAGSLSAASFAIAGGSSSRISVLSVSTGTITVAGDITFSGTSGNARVTFTGAGTLNLGGDFSGAGTFTHGTGTVNYTNSTAQAIGTYSYNVLNLNGTGIVDVDHDLSAGAVTVNNGATLRANTTGVTVTFAALTISSGGSVVMNRDLTVNGATTISGTITFGSTSSSVRTMTFNGDVTLNVGAVWNETTTLAAPDITFNGSFTNNATTFTAQNGAHDFTGASKTVSGTTVSSMPNATFTASYTNTGILTVSTLTVSGSGTVKLTNNGTITASTSLTGSDEFINGATGILNIGGSIGISTLTATAAGNTVKYTDAVQTGKVTTYYNLTLSGSGAKTFNTTPTVNGVLSLEGTATVVVNTGVVTYGTNATLQYNTATSRTATSEEWITPFTATGGIVNAGGGAVTLNTAKVVNSALTLTYGDFITTSANMLTLGASATVNGGNDTSFVNGPMRNTWSASTAAKLFPIGKSTYQPITIDLTTPASPVMQAEVFDANSGGTFANPPISLISHNHYYQTSLVSGTGANGGSVTIPGGDLPTIPAAAAALVVAQSSTVNGLYTRLAGTNSGTNLVVTCSGYNPASGDFLVLGTTEGALPVELTRFTASSAKGGIILNWTTATEKNNAGFEVQRRSGSTGWQTLGFVQGNGSSNIEHQYMFKDGSLAAGTYTYRLKQIDRNGAFDYSNEIQGVVALTPGEYTLSQNYPNPFNPTTTIHFAVKSEQQVTLTVYNMLGEEVRIVFNEIARPNTLYSIAFDASGLASGTYFYKLHTTDRNEVKKMLLLK